MSLKKKSKFSVGDVVRYDEIVPLGGVKGIIVTVDNEGIGRGTDDPYEYIFMWFDRKLTLDDVIRPQVEDWEEHDGSEDTGNFIVAYADTLKICEGIEVKAHCNNCAYEDSCSLLRETVLCENSEFGLLRGEGKLDIDFCEQRKCKHKYTCLLNRWLK